MVIVDGKLPLVDHTVNRLIGCPFLFFFIFFKQYESGPLAGQLIQIEKDEAMFWEKETEALWGATDFWGNWVPGLYLRELPVFDATQYGVPEIL